MVGESYKYSCVNDIEIAKSLSRDAIHFNTYGGNPVACAVGSTVIDVSILSFISEHSIFTIIGYWRGWDTIKCFKSWWSVYKGHDEVEGWVWGGRWHKRQGAYAGNGACDR